MSEGKQISRVELARRIAAVEKVVSELNWRHNDCLPKAVAFTHGLPIDYHQLGIHARGFVYKAIEASKVIAERNNEESSVDTFVLEDNNEVSQKIGNVLEQSDKAWIFYGDGENSHALGVLKAYEDEYMVANLEVDNPYKRMTKNEVVERLIGYSKQMELGICLIGFKRN